MGWDKNIIKSDFSSRGCLPNLAKYYLIVVNTLLMLAGVLLCGLGIYFLINHSAGSTGLTGSAIRWFVGGIASILLSMLVLSATYREKVKLLKIYLGLLIVSVFLRSVLVIWRDNQIDHHSTPTLSNWKSHFDLYGTDHTATLTVDILQKKLSCCGFDGPETVALKNGGYPPSCCSQLVDVCMMPFPDKCSSKLDALTSRATIAYNATLYTIIGVKVLAIIATAYFISFLEKHQEQQLSTRYNNF